MLVVLILLSQSSYSMRVSITTSSADGLLESGPGLMIVVFFTRRSNKSQTKGSFPKRSTSRVKVIWPSCALLAISVMTIFLKMGVPCFVTLTNPVDVVTITCSPVFLSVYTLFFTYQGSSGFLSTRDGFSNSSVCGAASGSGAVTGCAANSVGVMEPSFWVQ